MTNVQDALNDARANIAAALSERNRRTAACSEKISKISTWCTSSIGSQSREMPVIVTDIGDEQLGNEGCVYTLESSDRHVSGALTFQATGPSIVVSRETKAPWETADRFVYPAREADTFDSAAVEQFIVEFLTWVSSFAAHTMPPKTPNPLFGID